MKENYFSSKISNRYRKMSLYQFKGVIIIIIVYIIIIENTGPIELEKGYL